MRTVCKHCKRKIFFLFKPNISSQNDFNFLNTARTQYFLNFCSLTIFWIFARSLLRACSLLLTVTSSLFLAYSLARKDWRRCACLKSAATTGPSDTPCGMRAPFPKKKRLLFCTTGVLLHWLQSKNALDSVTHVVVDKVHKLHFNTYVLLAVLKVTVVVDECCKKQHDSN